MQPRHVLDTADIPGGGTLRLVRRGDDFAILLGANELMNSRVGGSEGALAALTIERLHRTSPAILIGGYGMGFTLRAALARLDAGASVTVAELVPAVIDWAKGPMAALTAGCLDDPRVAVRIEDVGHTIAEARSGYDAILLDVDNGPDGLSRGANDGLYGAPGLAAAAGALAPDGILAIWSAAPDAAFVRRLKQAGFAVEEIAVRAMRSGRGARHVIWFARRSGR